MPKTTNKGCNKFCKSIKCTRLSAHIRAALCYNEQKEYICRCSYYSPPVNYDCAFILKTGSPKPTELQPYWDQIPLIILIAKFQLYGKVKNG